MNSLEMVASWKELLRCSDEQINSLIFWAQHRYKHYEIPKRSGGSRHIHHPSPEVKVIQRWISANVIAALPVHDCVYSYRKDRSIHSHASRHADANYVLRMDFKDFFPSISEHQIKDHLFQHVHSRRLDIDFAGAALVARLLCRRDKTTGQSALSIGAPSSPAITNSLLFDFDSAVDNAARGRGCTYTRYADDLYFSTQAPGVLRELQNEIAGLAEKLLPHQKLNEEKTCHISRKARIVITGLVLTPQRKISIGRATKRRVRTELHLFLSDRLSPEKTACLKGLIAHIHSIEPTYLEQLARKFGRDALEKLKRA